jgi:uncharacterized protein DUF6790
MSAALPSMVLAVAWLLAILDVTPPGASASVPFDESALRWILYMAVGWTGVAAGLMHTVFARSTAKSIGWETSGFQYEVGFANLGIGLAGLYAAGRDTSDAWVAAAIPAGVFLLLAAANHIREMFAERNFAPGNTLILVSDLGIPISLLVLLLATNAI